MTDTSVTTLTSRCYSLGHTNVLELVGECDVATVAYLRQTVVGALGQDHAALIVDLTRVPFCDAASAAVLLWAGQRTQVALVGMKGIVARVFQILDPGRTLTRRPSVTEAVRDLARA